ncbi:hypothetical protein IQ266_21885 [filamentous cyanobacterium LEGE 11480]|uniref:Uncharacterized protein n=1 Tax=Romeriopsis navalis LEGE 11480 TaxID=2777977 RepID=A0A928VRE6_9CYAN|nr:hypothetical protein [Romeriopsis navalis]MBE9032393.1 hypothetical protein [Romeriopsis navalis LEGE 11480]
MNIRFAIACFFILFGLAQFWGWMQQFSLEQPIFVLGGLLLAIASNFNRRAAFPFDLLHQWLEQRSTQTTDTSAGE